MCSSIDRSIDLYLDTKMGEKRRKRGKKGEEKKRPDPRNLLFIDDFFNFKIGFFEKSKSGGATIFSASEASDKICCPGDLDFSKKPRGAKNAEIPFVRSRMSTCFRRNFQISGFSGKSGFSLISGSKNQKTPDFSA